MPLTPSTLSLSRDPTSVMVLSETVTIWARARRSMRMLARQFARRLWVTSRLVTQRAVRLDSLSGPAVMDGQRVEALAIIQLNFRRR
jgi:hypothetical protein